MDSREFEARQLAAWLLAHAWDEVTILEGMRAVLGPGKLGWHRVLARELADWGANPYPPAPERIVALLLQSAFFEPKRAAVPVLEPPLFAPAAAFAGLAVPQLATPGELAAWLGLDMPVLEWLAGTRPAGTAALQHYRYALIPKRNGAARLLEAPKARLKAIQRKILHEILDPVPVHNAAHGFVRKRSCLTAAQIHAGEGVVAAFDLARFFPSIAAPRVHGLFRRLGYPSTVARLLTGLCTTVTPAGIAVPREVYGVPHLPQGAPTSPALANLLAWRLDARLAGLARAAGANYTRYADDLAFSGSAVGFGAVVEKIVREEGFALNPAKSRVMRRHARQMITGIVVNAHCNVPRAEFDALKAILFNCIRHGPAAQNHENIPDFRRHLEGRVAWVAQINPRRGEKLCALFDRIEW
jgi:retron-type reverse transcriptase